MNMDKNIIYGKTLSEYKRKYRNCKRNLLFYSKEEVETFDAKFSKSAQVDKVLLQGRKWAYINGTYYEIPKSPSWTWFRNLNSTVQVFTCGLLGAGVVTAAVVTPLILLNNRRVEVDVNNIEVDKSEDLNIIFSKIANDNYEFIISVKDSSKDEVILKGVSEVYVGEYKLSDNEYKVIESTQDEKLILSINNKVFASHKGKIFVKSNITYKGPQLTDLDVKCLASCSLDNALLRDDIEVTARFEDSSEKKITKWRSKEFIGDKYTFKDDVTSQTFDITYRDLTKQLNVTVNKTFDYGKVTLAQWNNALKVITDKETRNFKIYYDDEGHCTSISKDNSYMIIEGFYPWYEIYYKGIYWKLSRDEEYETKFKCRLYGYDNTYYAENLDLDYVGKEFESYSNYATNFVYKRCVKQYNNYKFQTEEYSSAGFDNCYVLENDQFNLAIKFQPDKIRGTIPHKFYCSNKVYGATANYKFEDFGLVDDKNWLDIHNFVYDTKFEKKENGTNSYTYEFGDMDYEDYVFFAIDLSNPNRDAPDYSLNNIIKMNCDTGVIPLNGSDDQIYSAKKGLYYDNKSPEENDYTNNSDNLVLNSGRIIDNDTLFIRLVGQLETYTQDPWHNAKFEFSYNIPN